MSAKASGTRLRGLTGADSPLARWLPFLNWWSRVDRQTLRADLIAGLTGGIILVPQGVAFATIAGMPPEYGEPLKLLVRGHYLAEIGEENFFPVKTNAVGAIYRKLDSEICRNCQVRIFSECKEFLPNGERRADIAYPAAAIRTEEG